MTMLRNKEVAMTEDRKDELGGVGDNDKLPSLWQREHDYRSFVPSGLAPKVVPSPDPH